MFSLLAAGEEVAHEFGTGRVWVASGSARLRRAKWQAVGASDGAAISDEQK